MNSRTGIHDQDHLESVFLYALQAIPPDEVSDVEAAIQACADCRRELEALRPVMQSFTFWPADVLRPAESLWGRLAQRISAETGTPPDLTAREAGPKPVWKEVAPGISCMLLAADRARNRVSMLVRLAPGTDYPAHRHAGIEELHLLSGELMINNRKLYPGEYSRAEPDTVDHRVRSETGCTCFLLTSADDVLF